MAFICIDTSTAVCSVALIQSGEVLRHHIERGEQNHAARLPMLLSEVLRYANEEKVPIEAVALSEGPGSYTGLRIGTATAKGLCYGLNVPLLAIPTLQLLAAGVQATDDALLCPMIDARRMEVYCALYDSHLEQKTEVQAKVIDEDSFAEELQRSKICFFGDGADKCKSVIRSENAVFIDGIVPDAANMWQLAKAAYDEKKFEDIAYFDPFYLKEYHAVLSKNKVLQ